MPPNSSSSPMFPKLFEPGRIGRLLLNNRLIKAPMVTGLATRDGCVTDRMIRYYREVSRGGISLVIVEHSHVDNKASKAIPCQLSSSHEEHKAGLSWLATTIKSNGPKACLQVGHAGRRKHLQMPPVKAPSRVDSEESRKAGMPVPEELTIEEIEEIVEAFGDAALRAKQTGFDMVEIVGSHGYLVTNFLSPLANRRTDGYGGHLKNRMRFLLEIVDNIFQKVGKDYPLSIRLSGSDYEEGGITIEETKKVAVALERAGVCTIHVSGGASDTRHMVCASMYGPMATHVWAAEEIKKVVNIPIIASGSITTPQLAETIMKQGKADFISLGRPLLADPYFPLKAQEGRPEDIRPCIRCLDGCVTRGHAKGFINCTVNAALVKDEEFGGPTAGKPLKVAVIGGGPAGMEAARVAALRGHQVTLFEKRKMGGALIEASVPEFKADIRGLIIYLSEQIKKAGIKIVNIEATSKMVKDGQFDAVIVATGSTLSGQGVPGIDKPRVVGVLDVFQGVKTGKSVAVIGGGRIGCDAALFLAEQGKKVTLTTRGDDIARGMNHSERLGYFERLSKQSVEIRTGVHLEEVTDSGIIVGDKAGAGSAIEVDHVVLALGLTPNRKLFDELSKASDLKVYAIGDCAEPRTIFDAVHEAYWTAYNLL
jgi:2,4-dienoyl-CoA reductase-like NADH-dependent reductase (Old Yellow Enzyme family)/thioredoxin reductase